ncbi:MAG: stage II sporulation protein R [Lachnospirales bacterium]
MIKKHITRNDIQLLVISIVLAILVLFLHNIYENKEVQKNLQDNIIRLHIRGKSNSSEDQSFKIYIRDMVLTYVEENLSKGYIKEDVETFITSNIEAIEDYVDYLIKSGGYSYTSEVLFDYEDFPLKTYGFITVPKGTYKSLIINLDKGYGNNWWCVVFPPLCYVESDTLTFSDESIKTLETILEEETFNSITSTKGNITMDFKILEIFEKMK